MLKRVERGSQACDTLSKMMSERAAVEGRYAKDLASWSDRWEAKCDKMGQNTTLGVG